MQQKRSRLTDTNNNEGLPVGRGKGGWAEQEQTRRYKVSHQGLLYNTGHTAVFHDKRNGALG